MKRCPQCDFIYLDTDDICDLDGTPLADADDSEIDAVPQLTQARSIEAPQKRPLIAALIAGLALATILLVTYYALNRRSQRAVELPQTSTQLPLTVEAQASPSPSPSSSPSLEISPVPSKTVASSNTPSRATVSRNPVSTTATQLGQTAHAVIHLTNGARLEADEVWRTKEGYWYRRNGIVTLIKANRVRTIEKVSN